MSTFIYFMAAFINYILCAIIFYRLGTKNGQRLVFEDFNKQKDKLCFYSLLEMNRKEYLNYIQKVNEARKGK